MYIDGPPVTQPSSISVATGTHGRAVAPPKSSAKRTVGLIALLLILVGGSLTGMFFYRRSVLSRVTASPSPPMHAATAKIEGDRVEPTGKPSAETTVGDANDAGSAISIIAVGTESRTQPKLPPQGRGRPGAQKANPAPSTITQPTPPATTPPSPPPTPTPHNDECSTPYWFDAQGVKHYKEQCFGH
jgi:hypothetical protein